MSNDNYLDLFSTPIREELDDFRQVSDGIGIFYYIFTLVFIGNTAVFSQGLSSVHLFFINFDIVSLFFIILYFDYKRDRQITTENKVLVKRGIKGIIFLIIISTLWFLFWELLPIPYLTIPKAQITFFGGEMGYQIFRTIPVEELAFRGTLMFLIYLASSKILSLNREKTEDVENTIYRISWWFAIILSGIIFGLWHIPSYLTEGFPYFIIGEDGGYYYIRHIFYPILYLSMGGIFMGYLRYKYGLIYAIAFHIFNNVYAMSMLIILL